MEITKKKYECQTVGDLKKALNELNVVDATPLIGISDDFIIGQGLVLEYILNSKMDANEGSPKTGLSVEVTY